MTDDNQRQARILVVEDEQVALDNVVLVLRKEGYEAIAAGSGPAALKVLKQNADLDLVITDLRMEKVDGMQILRRENQRLRQLVTQDPAMEKLLDTARQIAPSDASVIISGESGTGKELLARFIHDHSQR